MGPAGDRQDHPGDGDCQHHQEPGDAEHRAETLSAVLAGKADLREVIDAVLERRKLYQTKTVLFVKDVREALNGGCKARAIFAPSLCLLLIRLLAEQ